MMKSIVYPRWMPLFEAARVIVENASHLSDNDDSFIVRESHMQQLIYALEEQSPGGTPHVGDVPPSVAIDEKHRWYGAGHLAGLEWAIKAVSRLSSRATMREAIGALECLLGSTYAVPDELPTSPAPVILHGARCASCAAKLDV